MVLCIYRMTNSKYSSNCLLKPTSICRVFSCFASKTEVCIKDKKNASCIPAELLVHWGFPGWSYPEQESLALCRF